VTNLTNSKMTESSDKFGFVEGIRGHFHATHCLHLLVHCQKLVLGYLDFEFWYIAFIRAERVLVEFHCEWLRRIGGTLVKLCGVSCGLDAPCNKLIRLYFFTSLLDRIFRTIGIKYAYDSTSSLCP